VNQVFFNPDRDKIESKLPPFDVKEMDRQVSVAQKLRVRSVNVRDRSVLMTRYKGSEQEKDLTIPPNAEGFGRIHHFRRHSESGWIPNPLPIGPASKALGQDLGTECTAEVYQNAICNWRCWYCYVPFKLLSGLPEHSEWIKAERLVELFLEIPDRPKIMDLSGGQPDLVPEWVSWTLSALQERNANDVYVWSDDNLSSELFWNVLSEAQIGAIREFRNYGKVCCLKGFDQSSFQFNTNAHPSLFNFQLSLLRRTLQIGLDTYVYITLTCPNSVDIGKKITQLGDDLQKIDDQLPLRVVPLEVKKYSPVLERITKVGHNALDHQWDVLSEWQEMLEKRYSAKERAVPIEEVKLESNVH